MDLKVESSEKEHFNKLAEEQETPFWGNLTEAGKRRQDIRAKRAIKFTRMDAGMPVLEIGCGSGDFTKRIAKSNAQITAIDISDKLIESAISKLKNENINFTVGSVYNLPFSNNVFDAVVGNSILHHIDLNLALIEIKRVLKHNGKIWFSEPNLINPQVFLEIKVKLIGRLLQNSPDETAFIRWKLKRVLECRKFGHVKVQPFDFLYPLTPAIFINIAERAGLILERIPIIKEIAGSLEVSACAESI